VCSNKDPSQPKIKMNKSVWNVITCAYFYLRHWGKVKFTIMKGFKERLKGDLL